MAAGVFPRAGPGRAFILAIHSLVRRTEVTSQRVDATRILRSMLQNLEKSRYIVVTGQKGVGKTVVVDTVTQRTCGVVCLPVAPGTAHDTPLCCGPLPLEKCRFYRSS